MKSNNKKENALHSPMANSKEWWLALLGIVILTAATRFYKVSEPNHVCWDETHFGKMASWYINRTFFFDVHPPLGKMLIALSGYVSGYDGTFAFEKPGDKYEGTNYVGMRMFCTLLGSCIVPFAFVTVAEMTKSLTAAVFSSFLLICDIGMITLNQYILLDPILLFFVSGSVMGIVKVRGLQEEAFTGKWWSFLIFTGFMLAGSVSVKFVGLFVVLLCGFYTIAELWELIGDMSQTVAVIMKHFIARTVCLILLPVLLYMAFFYIHLTVLNKSGSGDGFYSSAFQSQLKGNSLYNASMPRQLAFGATVTLKNARTGGGYLHSHWHLYPAGVGAQQQQVTTYTHKDDNNKWLVKPYDREVDNSESVDLVRNGDLIRLEHITTKRNLHSHSERAPLTKKHFQVTGYGEKGVGDNNDVWRIVIEGGQDGDVVETLTSKLRFVHYFQACCLTASSKQLPKWAFEQHEVSCNPSSRDPNAVWNIEDNQFPHLPNVSFSVYAPGFIDKFLESHAVMLQGNAGLKPKEGEVTSRPWQWPLNYKGQFFSGSSYTIYLLGNPVIWWCNLLFLPIGLLLLLIDAVIRQRNSDLELSDVARQRTTQTCLWLLAAWALHYIPFWSMGRVLYYHHYFPALYFSSMLTGVIFSYFLECIMHHLPQTTAAPTYHIITGIFISCTCYSFYLFSPLTYGMNNPPGHEKNNTMQNLRWLDSWEF